jgi:S-(hydroxymethyl)glutathione dehydrogenase/alcohol dehydrogenase
MVAAILTETGKPLVVDRVELPERLDHGQVLVKIHWSSLCGSQLGEIDAAKGTDRWLPHLLGHEGSGTVAAVGPGVTAVRVGDRVAMHWRRGRGIESATPAYRWRGERLNAGWVTTFSEFAVVSENRVTAVGGAADMRLVPLFGCVVTTGFGIVNNNARLKIGESIVVYGAGGVGQAVVLGARMVSANPIVAVDRAAEKFDLVRAFGATHTLSGSADTWPDRIREIVGPAGAHVAVDTTGDPRVIEQAYAITRKRGRTILAGVPRAGNHISIYSLPLHFGKVLTGSEGGEADPAEDIPNYLRLLLAGKLPLEPMITDTVTLANINEGFDRMRSGALRGRCLVEIAPGG